MSNRFRPFSAWPWLIRERWQRLRRAFAYATGRLSEDEAQTLICEIRDVAGWYDLMTISPRSVLENAIAIHGDKALRLKPYLDAACDRVSRKWDCGDDWGFALDFALETATEYAAHDGVTLEDDTNQPAVAPEPEGDHAHA